MKPIPILKEHKDRIDFSVIEFYTEKRRKLVRDKRTSTDTDGHPHVHPLLVCGSEVYIVCPYCGEIHSHSKAPGYRVPHCNDAVNRNKPNYCIENWEEFADAGQ